MLWYSNIRFHFLNTDVLESLLLVNGYKGSDFPSSLNFLSFWPLTIKPAVSLCEGGLQELTVLLDRFEEVPLTLEAQRLLHLTGAAGVVLRTESQVLSCPTNRREHWVKG